jgi:lysosomal acid lipase/cholesteryl ester hydrolase
MFRINGL